MKNIWKIIMSLFKNATIKIVKLECTCSACPTQYEGKLEDGKMFYLRYRWGYLSIRISPCETDNVMDAVSGEEIYGESIGGDFDGSLDHQEVINYLLKAGLEYDQHN